MSIPILTPTPTPSPEPEIETLTGFYAFACYTPMYSMPSLMAIFMLPNVIFMILGRIKGAYGSSWFTNCMGIYLNCGWAIVTNSIICMEVEPKNKWGYYVTMALTLTLFISSAIFSKFYYGKCSDKVEMLQRHRSTSILLNGMRDDGVIDVNALIDKVYASPPAIQIFGTVRSKDSFTDKNDQPFRITVPYGSWQSPPRTQPYIQGTIDYGLISVVPKFYLTKGIRERISNKEHELKVQFEQRNYQVITMKSICLIPGIKSKYSNFENSKIGKFIQRFGMCFQIFLNMFGYLPLYENFCGLFATDVVINVDKSISESDNFQNPYPLQSTGQQTVVQNLQTKKPLVGKKKQVENPSLNEALINDPPIAMVEQEETPVNPYASISDDVPYPYNNENLFPL